MFAQELVYEMEVTDLAGGQRRRLDVHDFLYELLSERCSVSASAPRGVGVELSLRRTLNSWNRCKVKTGAAR